MNAWKAVFLVFWLALPVAGSEVPEKIVEQLLELGYDASYLEAQPIELNRGGEPEITVHGLGNSMCDAENCATLVYQKDANGYRLLLDPGYVNRIEPQRSYTKGYRDLMVVVQDSAWDSSVVLYKFDGEEYQQDSCFLQTYRYEDRHGTLREWKEPKTTRIDCFEECC